MDDCDFAQQWPRLWGADSSPSTLMALPSCTVTHTPHSTLPHARQHVRTWVSSPAVASASSARARMGATIEELTAAAAPVTAIVFTKLRRDMVSCAIKSPPLSFLFLCRLLHRACGDCPTARRWAESVGHNGEGNPRQPGAVSRRPPGTVSPERFKTGAYGRNSTKAQVGTIHRASMIRLIISTGTGSYERERPGEMRWRPTGGREGPFRSPLRFFLLRTRAYSTSILSTRLMSSCWEWTSSLR